MEAHPLNAGQATAHVADVLLELRHAARGGNRLGLTQAALAALAGLAVSTYLTFAASEMLCSSPWNSRTFGYFFSRIVIR